MSWAHLTQFTPERHSAGLARDFVVLVLGEHDLTPFVDDVRLVVSELATNALRHARTPFTVCLAGCAGWLVLTVSDGSAVLPVPAATGELSQSGRGMAIVDALSHKWGVTHHQGEAKSVWASFATG